MTNVFQTRDEPKVLKAMELVELELSADFNSVVQQSLDRMKEHLDQLNAIIRCDNLPHVNASATDMTRLCDYLIHLILLHPPQKSKLFIYIKCNQISELLPAGISGRQQLYEICFHTNSCNEASWQLAHQQEIAECAVICAQYHGTFTAAFGHTDCLFKITLPGKLF